MNIGSWSRIVKLGPRNGFLRYFIIITIVLLFLTTETRPLYNKLIHKVGQVLKKCMLQRLAFIHVTSCTTSKYLTARLTVISLDVMFVVARLFILYRGFMAQRRLSREKLWVHSLMPSLSLLHSTHILVGAVAAQIQATSQAAASTATTATSATNSSGKYSF